MSRQELGTTTIIIIAVMESKNKRMNSLCLSGMHVEIVNEFWPVSGSSGIFNNIRKFSSKAEIQEQLLERKRAQ